MKFLKTTPPSKQPPFGAPTQERHYESNCLRNSCIISAGIQCFENPQNLQERGTFSTNYAAKRHLCQTTLRFLELEGVYWAQTPRTPPSNLLRPPLMRGRFGIDSTLIRHGFPPDLILFRCQI